MAAQSETLRIAERELVGALLLHPEAFAAAAGLRPEHFLQPALAVVFRTIAMANEAGQPADLLGVIGALERGGRLADVGGREALLDLVQEVVHGGNVDYHAQIVREHARRRQLSAAAQQLAAQARDGDLGEAMAEARHLFDAITPDDVDKAPRLRIYTEIELAALPAPRSLVHGLLPEGLTVLAAEPKVGKTHFANAIAFAMVNGAETWQGLAIRSGPVLFCVAEGLAGQGQRWRGLRVANPGARALHPMLFCPAPNLMDARECRLFEEALDEHRPLLAVLDTWAAVTPGLKENDTEHVGPVTRRLVQWRERFGTNWLVPHHLRKLPAGVEPTMADVRGSIALAAAADGVVLMFRRRGIIIARPEAMRDIEAGADLRLRLLPVELSDGGTTVFMAAAVEPTEEAAPKQDSKEDRAEAKIVSDAARLAVVVATAPGLNSEEAFGEVASATHGGMGAARFSTARRKLSTALVEVPGTRTEKLLYLDGSKVSSVVVAAVAPEDRDRVLSSRVPAPAPPSPTQPHREGLSGSHCSRPREPKARGRETSGRTLPVGVGASGAQPDRNGVLPQHAREDGVHVTDPEDIAELLHERLFGTGGAP